MPPICEEVLIYFVAHCYSVLRISHSTIKLYLCGIRFQYLMTNVPSPFSDDTGRHVLRLQMILKAVKKNCPRSVLRRYPITASVLTKICVTLKHGLFTPYTDFMLHTVCTVAFFGFLRCGEFTCLSTFDPAINLCVGDVYFTSDRAILLLKASKTDPFRRGITISLFNTELGVNPYPLLKQYCDIRRAEGAVPTDCLFVTQTGCPLTRSVFINHLKQIINHIGLDSRFYTGHSFRIGAASSSAKARIEGHLIQTLGRWSSDCYYRYIHTPLETLRDAQQSLALVS